MSLFYNLGVQSLKRRRRIPGLRVQDLQMQHSINLYGKKMNLFDLKLILEHSVKVRDKDEKAKKAFAGLFADVKSSGEVSFTLLV